ncbi:MAG: hypothetical protein JNL73_14630 [Anaerolineales bacterium]|nr:hypothetical protein [Anaerolineales bacterium]
MFRNWFTLTIVSSLVIGLAWAALRVFGALPPEGAQVAYPLLLAYYYGALPVSILLLVVVFSVGFWWLPLAMVRRPGWIGQGALVLLSVLAFGLSVWSAAPLTRLIYRDVAEVALPDALVRLGVRAAEPGSADNGYVVLTCPDLWCRVTYVPDPTGKFEPLASIRSEGSAAVIVLEGATLLRVQP